MPKTKPEISRKSLVYMEKHCGAGCYHDPENCKCFDLMSDEDMADLEYSVEEAEQYRLKSFKDCPIYLGGDKDEIKTELDFVLRDTADEKTKNEIASALFDADKTVKESLQKISFYVISKIKTKPINKEGYVYILQTEHGTKIGASSNPEVRVKAVGLLLPFETKKTEAFKVDNMFLAESELHTEYEEYRINGEWFDLSQSQIDEIRSLLSNEK